MFHMTNGREHIKYKNDVLLIAVYKTETNFYFEMYETIKDVMKENSQ